MGFLDFIKSSGGGSVAGSLLGGAFGLAGQALNNKYQKESEERQFGYQTKLNDQQQEHALAQMAQSQAYNEQNMATQNQYQIDAENRANAYNSVGAQVARARAAGVSPAAALGSGGAGGLMTAASAPSSSTPSPTGANAGSVSSRAPLLDLAQAVTSGAQVGAQIALSSSEQKNVEQNTALQAAQTVNQQIKNQYEAAISQAKLDGYKLTNSGLAIENEIKEYNRQIAEVTASNEPEKQRLSLLESLRRIAQINQAIDSDKTLTEAKRKELAASVESLTAAAVASGAQAGLYGAQKTLTEKQAVTEGYKALVQQNEAGRVKMLTDLGYSQKEAQDIANKFNKAHNDFKEKHFESDRRWEKAAIGVQMGQAIISSVCGAVGCAVSGGLIQPPKETVTVTREQYNTHEGRWEAAEVTTTHKEKNR